MSGKYYLEICLVTGPTGPHPWHLSLAGTFTTPHVYPQALQTQELPQGEREVSPGGVFTVRTQSHTVGMVGRDYQRDQGGMGEEEEEINL